MDNIKYKLSLKTKELYNQIIELIKLSNPGYSDNNYSYENFIKECFYVFDSIVDHTPVAISKWINGESIDSKRVNIAIQNILAVEKLSDILADSLDKMEIDKNDIHSLLLKLLNKTDLEITDEIRSLENHQLFAILLYSSLNIVNCNDIGDNYIETNHFKECLETLNSKITNNPIVHIYAPYGSGKTTLIQKYMSDNTDDSMIYTTDNTSDNTDDTTDNTSDNIMALISDTAKSFWEKLYESKIDTKIFNLFFQNDTSNYFAIIKNSIFFIDDFSPENVSSYIEFAKQHNLRVVFISNFSTVYSGILNYDISLTKERLQDLLLNYSKKKKIKCLSDTCMLSKLIDIIGYDLNIYHIIFKAYTILSRKESKDVADIFIQSILDYNLSILHEKYRMSLNSTDKNIKSHLKDYYNNIIPKTQRKTLLLLSKLNNHSVPRALLEKWFGINFDTIYIMVKHNLCHINNGIVHLHINSFFVYMLNLTAKWYDIDFDTYINTTIQLQEEVFKTTTKETSPLILLPILHRLMNPLSNYDKNNKSKKSCTIEQADFYFACIWYYVLHGDIAYAKTILNNLENAKYVKENSVSPFLLQHITYLIQKIDKSPSVSKYDSNLLELSNLLSDKKGQNTLQPIDIFFYIQYIVNRIDDFFFDILLDINPITKDSKKYCHTLLDRLFITTKECCSPADKTLYDISILYCDLYKRYYEMLFNDCFDLHQDYYNQLKTDINEACSINNYYVFFYKLRRYIVELVISVTNNTISQDEICNKIHEMSSLHFSYNAWTSFDIHFFTTMVFHILFEAKKTHPNSTEIEELYDCFFLAYLKHINDNQEIFRYQNNKDILMTQFYLDQQ